MNRFETAKIAQSGACNPIPLARGLQQAIYEIHEASGGTNAILEDPACRLIAHQLAYLFKTAELDDDHAEYTRLIAAIEGYSWLTPANCGSR